MMIRLRGTAWLMMHSMSPLYLQPRHELSSTQSPLASGLPVGEHKDQAVSCWEDPAGQQGHGDSAGGHDGVVLEGGGDVEEPVQGQHGGGDDGDENDPEPNAHLYLALPLNVVEVCSRLVSEADNQHHNYRQGKVSHGLVENEEKDGLTANPGLVQPSFCKNTRAI